MRAKEFLLEYNRDITARNPVYKDKLMNRLYNEYKSYMAGSYDRLQTTGSDWYHRRVRNMDKFINNVKTYNTLADGGPQLPPSLVLEITQQLQDTITSVVQFIEDADPTSHKQYTEWLVRGYISALFNRLEDVTSSAADFLNKFHKLKVHKKLPPEIADINRIKTRDQYKKARKIIITVFNREFQLDPLPEGKTKLIKELQNVKIVVPTDKAAACYWGEGTEWCTAVVPGRHPAGYTHNLFDDYKSGNLYVLIPKNPKHDGEKYQLFFDESLRVDRDDEEFVDEHNNEMDLRLIFDRFGDELRDWLVNIDENAEEYIMNRVDLVDLQIIEKLLKETGKFILEYAYNQVNELSSQFSGEEPKGDQQYIDNIKDIVKPTRAAEFRNLRTRQVNPLPPPHTNLQFSLFRDSFHFDIPRFPLLVASAIVLQSSHLGRPLDAEVKKRTVALQFLPLQMQRWVEKTLRVVPDRHENYKVVVKTERERGFLPAKDPAQDFYDIG